MGSVLSSSAIDPNPDNEDDDVDGTNVKMEGFVPEPSKEKDLVFEVGS